MFENIDIERSSEFDVISMLEGAIIDGFINSLRDGDIELDDEMLVSYLATVIKGDKQIDFIKAMGLAKFRDNKDACLAINDFCAFLKDARDMGEKKLHE